MTETAHSHFTILIIEDEEPLRRVLARRLEEESWRVIAAADGKVGLALAKENRPDLILLDLLMPTMDGVAVLKALGEDAACREIPIIILTNMNDIKAVIDAVEFGFFDIESRYTDRCLLPIARQCIKTYLEARLKNGIYDFLIKKDVELEDIVKKICHKLKTA